MNDADAETLEALRTELAELRAALTELAVVQAEALNAVSEHLRSETPGPLSASLKGKPDSWKAGQKTLDAAKRSLDVATKLLTV